jgi:hypothetical protein
VAVVGTVVDLAAADGQRLPGPSECQTVIDGIPLPRLAIASGVDPIPLVIGLLRTTESTR